MAEQVIMPKLGFDMAEGTLISWSKQLGDKISKGDVIAEIETDKATIEIESQVGGTILKFLAEPGAVLPVGSPIAYVGAEGEDVADAGGAKPAQAQASAEAAVAAPESAPGDTSGVHEGEARQDQTGATPQQPASAEIEPKGNGNYPEGLKASPIARRIADERGIDLRRVQGTGPGGRIVKKDVEDFPVGEAPAAPVQPTAAPAAAAPAAPAPAPTYGAVPTDQDVEEIPLGKMRSRIGQRMVQSKQQVPHFYVTSSIDVTALMDLRRQLNASLDDDAAKITVNDLIVKATALTLRQFPNLNSHYYGDKVVKHNRVNIGIAVATPDGGLINVVAQDADKTALGTMAAANREMIARARDGKIKPEDVEGSTFSVSNLGPYDVDHFIAIINPPEAGILAIGTAHKTPVVLADDTIGIGMIMKATISIDHRVSNGAEGAEFMKAFKTLIENPMRLVI
ncbi:MAG TPA: dihydrolipoamide acetyltransferase family protein [Aggregatilinea sp.]|uniref:dihydrolipoamide acetyltransferase family protein n=1 Tax=Aggregatilinea sp. TaxID=2806333 RepID=UPI002BE483AA|nr:dihydrolipoamide acetyltransferase family protein [Aggregatilinea sp.]HML23292.1 dihydrolipoamide acetyltransferase family protein [Aggregatilinea sp.]